MESILAWVMGTKLGMLVGGAAGGMVLTTGFVAAKRMLPGLLAKWVGAKITAGLNVADPADKALVLAVVRWAEAKLPDQGTGHDKFKMASAKLISFFPALAGQDERITALIEASVDALDAGLKKDIAGSGPSTPPAA